jgi:hypothetical protein
MQQFIVSCVAVALGLQLIHAHSAGVPDESFGSLKDSISSYIPESDLHEDRNENIEASELKIKVPK